MKYFKVTFSTVLLICAGLMTSCGGNDNKNDPPPKRVSASEFIIYPWDEMYANPAVGEYDGFTDMDALMRDMYDCGFNSSGFIDFRNLKYVRKNHLVGILAAGIDATKETTQEKADESIKKLMESITDPQDRKAVFAVYIRDEPKASLFPQLNIWSEAVRKQNVLPYINLFPDYANPEQLGSKDYEDHLSQYVNICKPSYISYDNYSVYEGGRLDEDRFYGNMELIRNHSLQTDIPFWNIISSDAFYNFAEPSDASLAVQVYSTLAYGGKGIGYFTYHTRPVVNCRLAPIDEFGYRTKTWEMLRHINLQIHTLAPVYVNLKSVNVFHTVSVPRNGKGINSAKLVEAISGGSVHPDKDASLLVGEFTDTEGKPYIMVVNKSLHSSVWVNVQFRKKGRIMVVSQFQQGKRYGGDDIWLAPGCGHLLTVE